MVNLHVENWSAKDLRYSVNQKRNMKTRSLAKAELLRRGLGIKAKSRKSLYSKSWW